MISEAKIFLILLLAALLFSCGNKTIDKTIDNQPVYAVIDLNDTNYASVKNSAVNTFTKQGWKIRYLTRQDSSEYGNIYLECSRDTVKDIFCCSDFRTKGLPVFYSETNDAVYFKYREQDTLRDLLAFSKISPEHFKECHNIVGYDLKMGVILYVPEKCISEEKKFELVMIDIPYLKKHRIPYKYYSKKISCVDSVVIKPEGVCIRTAFADQPSKGKTLKLTRDINR